MKCTGLKFIARPKKQLEGTSPAQYGSLRACDQNAAGEGYLQFFTWPAVSHMIDHGQGQKLHMSNRELARIIKNLT